MIETTLQEAAAAAGAAAGEQQPAAEQQPKERSSLAKDERMYKQLKDAAKAAMMDEWMGVAKRVPTVQGDEGERLP